MNYFTYLLRIFLFVSLIFSLSKVQAQSPFEDGYNPDNPSLAGKKLHGKINLSHYNALSDQFVQHQTVSIIVQLKQLRPLSAQNPGFSTTLQAQSDLIKTQQDAVIKSLNLGHIKSIKRFQYIPFLAMEVDEALLSRLLQSNEILSISEDKINRLTLDQSIPYIQADLVWEEGHSGKGQSIAILDTGIDATHSFLADLDSTTGESKVISEACYSTTQASFNSTAICLDGDTSPGAGINCTGISGCDHGTHLAGIAAGNGDIFSGVAKDASIISIQVFSRFDNEDLCNSLRPCVLSYTSDIIQGLERVFTLASNGTHDIASVNISIGGETFATAIDCNNSNLATKQAIDNLRAIGIATIVSSGNDGKTDSLSAPACISSAISVGATDNENNLASNNNNASYSNSSSWLSVLAPGSFILSSAPNDNFEFKSGTSMAAPHVAGAFAVLKSQSPTATVNQTLAALVNTGRIIVDPRNGLAKPRIKLDSASAALSFSALPANIILDNDFQGNQVQGSFTKISNSQSYNGTALLGNPAESNIFHFSPDLPQSGNYQIYGWWPALPDNATQASFEIAHDSGLSIVTVDQQANGNQWYKLGTYPLSRNSSTSIDITASNGTSVVVDAVRFEFLEELQAENVQIDFNNGELSNWTIKDKGNISTPSNWSASSGILRQSSNIYSGSSRQEDLPKIGTHILYNAGFGWINYQASFTMRSQDNDAAGVMFRYQDENNYYRFSWDKQRSYRRIIKRVNGVFTLLVEDNEQYVQGQTYQIQVTSSGPNLNLQIDGETIFSIIDSSLTSGTIAFYTWAQGGTFFDNLVVEQGENSLPILLSQGFDSDSLLESWSIIDQGSSSGPSTWSTSSGVLSQLSNISGGTNNKADLPKPGTHIRYDFGYDWKDYQANFIMRCRDDDSIGFLFRYQDKNNYYRFSWDKQRSFRRLVKKENGIFTLLAEDNVPFTQSQNYQIKISASESKLNIEIDGTAVFSVIDSSLTSGTVAFYTWAAAGVFFENLLIEDLE